MTAADTVAVIRSASPPTKVALSTWWERFKKKDRGDKGTVPLGCVRIRPEGLQIPLEYSAFLYKKASTTQMSQFL